MISAIGSATTTPPGHTFPTLSLRELTSTKVKKLVKQQLPAPISRSPYWGLMGTIVVLTVFGPMLQVAYVKPLATIPKSLETANRQASMTPEKMTNPNDSNSSNFLMMMSQAPTQPGPEAPSEPANDAEQSAQNLEKLKLWIDLGKFLLGSVVVAIVTTSINAQIQNKQLELERLKADREHLSQFTEQAMQDQLIKRLRFANYFATMTFSEDSRERWTEYSRQLEDELVIKTERLNVIYQALPDEMERASNTGDQEIVEALNREKESLESDIGVVPRAFSSEERFWNDEKLDSRIVDEAVFTWRQAIEGRHGEVDIVVSPEVTANIEDMALKLQAIQDQLGKPIEITRWYRQPQANERVGGARRNSHFTGGGVDIRVEGMTGQELYNLLDETWSGGMGLYDGIPDILHLDNRGYRARWGGNSQQ